MLNSMKLVRFVFWTWLGVLLSACAPALTLLPSLTPRLTAGAPTVTLTVTRTPYHPSTPTPPRRASATPLVTFTAAPQISVTVMLNPTFTPPTPPTLYVFPVQPASRATYGEGVAAHGYPAADIFADKGLKFVAVIDGLVDFVSYSDDWNPDKPDPAVRGGLAVAIIGIDGLRYYGSHLSEVADDVFVGARVKAGQVLGYIGNSGDARDTPTHLHFGISRPSTPNDWLARRGQLDPFPYLNAWRAGISLKPVFP